MLILENKMLIYKDKHQTLCTLCPYDLISNIKIKAYCVSFRVDEDNDFVNFSDIAKSLHVKIKPLIRSELYMSSSEYLNSVIDKADLVLDSFAVTYDTASENPKLYVVCTSDEKQRASVQKWGKCFEVFESTMSEVMLYRMKFGIERNRDMIERQWRKKKGCDKDARLHSELS